MSELDKEKAYKVTVSFQGKSEDTMVEITDRGWKALEEVCRLVEFITGADVMIMRVVYDEQQD